MTGWKKRFFQKGMRAVITLLFNAIRVFVKGNSGWSMGEKLSPSLNGLFRIEEFVNYTKMKTFGILRMRGFSFLKR